VLERTGNGLWEATTPLRVVVVESGRRMAVVRLRDGRLWVHSPAELTGELRDELDQLGPVRFVVPASKLHGHRFADQYAAAYPDAELWNAPGGRRRRGIEYANELGEAPDPRWAPEIDQVLLRGNTLANEVLFLHRPSRTLIVGDCLWNVTDQTTATARAWVGGGPGARPTRAFRRAIRDRAAFRESLSRVLDWDFDRIVIGHGENVEGGAKEVLRAAYEFLD
jgi:uncharacterized protein DUF4336